MKIILVLSLFINSALAQYSVSVGKANESKDGLLINIVKCDDIPITKRNQYSSAIKVVSDTVKNDFLFYKHKFDVTYRESKVAISRDKNLQEPFAKEGIGKIIEVNCTGLDASSSVLMSLYDISEGKVKATTDVNLLAGDLRSATHRADDLIYRGITGEQSVFNSKVAFVSNEKSGLKNNIKELYIMDFDGFNTKKLTSHRGIVLSPAFSPDNTKIIYSLIDSKVSKYRNIALYELDLVGKSKKLISNKKGINSGAVYTADGTGIYLTLSHGNNSEIYHMDLKTSQLRKVTSHYAIDVDPSINRDGSLLTFLSSRQGKASIFTMNPSMTEGNVKRISYVGKFNATPRFSPDGSEIVFASWLDNSFDLFRLTSSGHSLVRLTKNFGNNEDPSYSPDGNFIIFSSQRVISRVKADQNLYIMTRDGEILGQLTNNIGQCSTPRFSN